MFNRCLCQVFFYFPLPAYFLPDICSATSMCSAVCAKHSGTRTYRLSAPGFPSQGLGAVLRAAASAQRKMQTFLTGSQTGLQASIREEHLPPPFASSRRARKTAVRPVFWFCACCWERLKILSGHTGTPCSSLQKQSVRKRTGGLGSSGSEYEMAVVDINRLQII